MKLINLLLGLMSVVLATALPTAEKFSVWDTPSANTSRLDTRQWLEAGAVTSCCTDCTARYSYDDLWQTFDDLCTWLGGGQNLWTTQAYYTRDYYCRPYWNANICVRLQVQYFCGEHEAPVSDSNPAGAMDVDYYGCIGYFEDSITPANVCDGPNYPGGQTTTADGCWVFSVVNEDSPYTKSDFGLPVNNLIDSLDDSGLDCEPGARMCPIETHANGTVLEGAVAKAKFGSPIQKRIV